MDGLRWLLLLFGLLVVAGVYFYSRRQRAETDVEPKAAATTGSSAGDRVEPSLGGADDAQALAEDVDDSVDASSDEVDDELAAQSQKIVTLRIIAANNGTFAGDELLLSLRGIGMRHGKFGIFHQYDGSDEENVVFSAASLVEPGSFDLVNIKDQQIPGISLFMVLPGPVEGAQAFDLMMFAARALNQSLTSDLLDESGSTLSVQRERYLREEIIQFEHGILVA